MQGWLMGKESNYMYGIKIQKRSSSPSLPLEVSSLDNWRTNGGPGLYPAPTEHHNQATFYLTVQRRDKRSHISGYVLPFIADENFRGLQHQEYRYSIGGHF